MTESSKNVINLYQQLGNLKDDFRNFNLYHFILKRIKEGNALDIGSGNGFLVNLLEENGKRAIGIEPNQELIKIAKKQFPKLTLLCGKMEELNKINDKFSTITLIDVLEHIKDDDLSIQLIHQFLKNNGRLVVVVPAFQFLYGIRDKLLGHYRRYKRKELIQKLLNSGFKIIEIRYWNMLGFISYSFHQKLLNRSSNFYLRTERSKNMFEKLCVLLLHLWYKYIENNINLGFGLSLICVAEKARKESIFKTA